MVAFSLSRDAPPEPTRAPTRVRGDVKRVTSRHSAHRITVTVFFRDLARAGDDRTDTLRIVTDAHREWEVLDQSQPGHWAGHTELVTARGATARCHVRRVADYAANTLVLSVPRRCVGNPRWVRLGFEVEISKGERVYVDDARRRGYPDITASPRLGRRTYRG